MAEREIINLTKESVGFGIDEVSIEELERRIEPVVQQMFEAGCIFCPSACPGFCPEACGINCPADSSPQQP